MAAMLAGCLALGACGGGSGGGTTATASGAGNTPAATAATVSTSAVSAAAASAGELSASQPGELLAVAKTLITERAKAGLGSGGGVAVNNLGNPAPAPAPAAPGAVATHGFSGTTLQEAGVDEDDLIKTDGNMIYSIAYRFRETVYSQLPPVTVASQTNRLQAHQRAANGVATKTATVDLTQNAWITGMYLAPAAKRIAVMGTRFDVIPVDVQPSTAASIAPSVPYPTRGVNKVTLTLVNTSAPNSLPIEKNVVIDGTLVGSRLIGNTLYLVTTWSPYLPSDALPTAAEREAAVAKLKTTDLLPTIQIDGNTATPLMADTDCYVQNRNASLHLQMTTITAIDLTSPALQRNSRCFLGCNEALYMSQRNVYVATTRYTYSGDVSGKWFYPPDITTDIHKFSLDGLAVRYKASGEVKGHLAACRT